MYWSKDIYLMLEKKKGICGICKSWLTILCGRIQGGKISVLGSWICFQDHVSTMSEHCGKSITFLFLLILHPLILCPITLFFCSYNQVIFYLFGVPLPQQNFQLFYLKRERESERGRGERERDGGEDYDKIRENSERQKMSKQGEKWIVHFHYSARPREVERHQCSKWIFIWSKEPRENHEGAIFA